MFTAPPSTKRPDWKTVTTVEPKAKLSGSTWDSCCASLRPVRVARELAAHDLAIGRDLVSELGEHDVAPGAAPDRVDPAVSARGEPVVPRASRETVAPGATVEEIARTATVELIISPLTVKLVRQRCSREPVRAAPPR